MNIFSLKNGELLTLVFIAFFLPIKAKLVVYGIAAFSLVSLITWLKQGVQKLQFQFYPFIILFICYLVGLFFTSNFDYGGKDIETRFTFLLFPILFGITKRNYIIELKWILYAFILGCLVTSYFCFQRAQECFDIFGYDRCFVGSRFSGEIHPTYLALYFIAAATFYTVFLVKEKQHWLHRLIAIPVIIYLFYLVYLLDSLGPWVSLVGMLVAVLIAVFYFSRKLIHLFLGGCAALIILGVVFFNVDFIKKDLIEVNDEVELYFANEAAYTEAHEGNLSSISSRIIVWGACADFISSHPFGVGTGDSMDELMSFYKSRGMEVYAEARLNPHCQYLQTTIAIGWLGGVLLLIIFGYFIYYGFKCQNLYIIALAALIATACLFESVIERQWGILFLLFFLNLFMVNNQNRTAEFG